MKLYNSLTREVEEFKPLRDSEISIYSCGPTVYERAHIGNLASFIYADTLKRALALKFPDTKIKHTMNLTDVDDKTIKRSQEEYPGLEPMEALKKLTRHYEDLFMKDLEAVGFDIDSITFVRATEYIPQMQTLIRKLVMAGVGYITDDGVYFSIAKYKKTGKTYGQLVDITAESTGAARVNNDEYDKDNIHDFALWKKQKYAEPAWDFEIDGQDLKGRPGWHIECSAMSVGKLDQPFDIHTGGVDLKFPHHENEIAQSTAVSDQDLLANFFFHSEHLLVDGKKMSKSLNNFYTLDDHELLRREPSSLRTFVLNGNYRSRVDFTTDSIAESLVHIDELTELADLVFQPARKERENKIDQWLDESKMRIKKYLQEDLNTHAALQELYRMARNISVTGIAVHNTASFNDFLKFIKNVFGIDLINRKDITGDQKQLIAEREEARKSQDFATSDELRDKLAQQEIGLRDTQHGAIWYRR